MTTTDPNNDPDVKNGIGKALANRIIKAHKFDKTLLLTNTL